MSYNISNNVGWISWIQKAMKYILPFVLYLAINPILGLFLEDPIYAGYIIKTFLVTGALIYYWKQYKEIEFKFDFYSILIGILIFVIWIGIDSLYPHIGEPSMFNPFVFGGFKAIFILIVRLFGAILVAPIVEELFVRSFLIRYIIKEDFENVKIGTYSLSSFIITMLFFGLSHQRWLAGLITGIILNVWLYRKKNITSCIIAHSAANACLAAYVIMTGSWQFW